MDENNQVVLSALLKKIRNAAIIGVPLLFGSCTAYSNYFSVYPSEMAVITRAGNFEGLVGPGPHFTMPFIGDYVIYSTKVRSFETKPLNTYTSDNQEVDAKITVQWRADASEIAYLYSNVSGVTSDYPPVLYQMVVDRWKVEAGKANVSTIASSRGELIKSVKDIVTSEAKRLYHLEVVDVQLTDLQYQDSYRDAQAKAATVKTQIEASQGMQHKAQIDAETAKIVASGLANQQIEQARGLAEATRLQAIAEAEKARIIGEANALAQEKMAAALTANPVLVQYEQAKHWNGQLPVNMYSSGPIPFLSVGK